MPTRRTAASVAPVSSQTSGAFASVDRPRGWPLRVHLVAFAILLLIPAIVFSSYLVMRFAAEQRAAAESRIVQIAGDLASDVSLDLERAIAKLRTLSFSSHIGRRDYSSFHNQATEVLGSFGEAILLVNPDGAQVVNTLVRYGEPLRPYSDPDSLAWVVANGQAHVSNLFFAKTRQAWVANVLAPIIRDGRVEQVLAMSITPQRLLHIISGQHAGPEWVTGIADRNGRIIARSRGHDEFVGTMLTPTLMAVNRDETQRDQPRIHRAVDLEGNRIVRAAISARTSGWVVVAAVSEEFMNAPSKRAVADLALMGVGLLVLTLLLVGVYGARLAASVRSLASISAGTVSPSMALIREASDAGAILSRTNEELRTARHSLQAALEVSNVVPWSWDESRKIRRWSARTKALFGLPPDDDVTQERFLSLLHPEDVPRFKAAWTAALDPSCGIYQLEYRIRRANDGVERRINSNAIVEFDRGRPVQMLGALRDVTEERASAAQREKLASLIEHSGDLIAVADARGHLEYMNRAGRLMIGADLDADIGTLHFFQFIAPPWREYMSAVVLPRVREHGLWEGEMQLANLKTGKLVDVFRSTFVLRDDEGRVASYATVMRDITEQKRQEAAMRRHADQQALLLEVTYALNEVGRDEASLAEVVFEKVGPVLGAEVCLNYRVNSVEGTLDLVFERGLEPSLRINATRIAGGETFCGTIASACQAMVADASPVACGPKGGVIQSAGFTAYVCHPLRAGDGRVLGTYSIGSMTRAEFGADEIALVQTVANFLAVSWERIHAERSLMTSERRFRELAESMPQLVWTASSEGEVNYYNQRREEYWKSAEGEWETLVHPDDIAATRRLWEQAVVDQRSFECEHRLRMKSGRFRWHLSRARPVRQGDLLLWYGTATDIDALKEAERLNSEREAHVRRILDNTLAFIGVMELDGTMIEANAAALNAGGLNREDVIGRKIWDCYWWSHDEAAVKRLKQAVARAGSGEVVRYDSVVRMAGDSRMTIDFMLSPVMDERGEVILLIPSGFDISERHSREEQIKLLMKEVNHRAKNLLTVVQAVARQTAKDGDPATFVERLRDRIGGLSASQDLLVKSEWRGVSLDELARTQLSHFSDLVDRRVTIEGPPLLITASAAQAIGMALHELATNSGKYGALSNDAGQVKLTWKVLNMGKTFRIEWLERDGPPVVPPLHRGFGHTIMVRMAEHALSGKVTLDYAPTGLMWSLTAPAIHAVEERTWRSLAS